MKRTCRHAWLPRYRPRWRLPDWVAAAIVLGAVLVMFLFLLGHHWLA
ncbi:hypothetical protein PQU95_00115 [Vogesella sp. DC21W]|uniref:Uncharacterized protein n=1 Tax=Vogesella aquatica TaxID=2984206 RepID=A0ABT5ISY7_9NEIS|nr:hypothetical protein [Vogesella aquatica]MDC7715622.1 hypothetical protein [Vogesella aquatica]